MAILSLVVTSVNRREENIDKDTTLKKYKLLIYVIDVMVLLGALFLSFKRNQGVNIGSLLAAVLCPWCYVAFALAVQVPRPVNPVRLNTRSNSPPF